MSVAPPTTGDGEALMPMLRSAPTFTVKPLLTLLLVVSGSVCVWVTLAVSVNVPAAVVVATIVMEATPYRARAPMEHVMVVVPEQVPCVGVAETSVREAGNTLVTTTFVEGSGPLLVAVTV